MFLGLGWVLLTTDGWQVAGLRMSFFGILSLHLSVFRGMAGDMPSYSFRDTYECQDGSAGSRVPHLCAFSGYSNLGLNGQPDIQGP